MKIQSSAVTLIIVCVVLGLTCGVSMGDTIFSVDHNDLPAVGEPVITWGNFNKTHGAPVVVEFGGEKWYEVTWARRDRLTHSSSPYAASIPINGATIVTAIKPVRGTGGDPWNSIVDIFYDQLCIGVHNETGRIKVKVSGENAANPIWTSATDKVIPEEAGVLSLSVDNTGDFEVFWRAESDEAAVSMGTGSGNLAGAPFTALYPNPTGTRNYARYINLGRNEPDSWPVFSGLIGDTVVYDEQLGPAALLAVQDQIRVAMGIGSGPVMMPGDADDSGFVDDSDLAILLGNWEKDPSIISTWELGNFTEASLGDTDVDDSDLAVLLGNWTRAPGGAAVPEPTTLALLAVGGLAATRRRRRFST